ncbi:MAG TPA: sialidase family protein, partial [Bacteroidota bacterium]|nr:sialidase family protein [Bacteroidota bacterium]
STSDDKQHATADFSGTYPNNVYAAWTDFARTGSPVVFARSTNQGATWGAGQVLQIGSNRGQGVHIATGPNGEVYVMWAHYTTGTAEVGIGFAKSTDGGATFSAPTIAFPINGIRISNGGIAALNNARAASFPYHDVDRSNGSRRGWIYVVTPELVSGQADIFLRRSTDGGTTWSAPIQVNGPDVQAGKWQFMASLAVDPTTGGISVSYYSMDSVGSNFMTNRYMAYSNDGGDTWDRWVISDVRALWAPQGTPNTNTTYNGDYYETAATNGKAWACWTDRRSGSTGQFNRAYVEVVTYSENFGWVRGTVTQLGGSTPVSGVAIDFVENVQQLGATTNSSGFYLAGARVDTPGTTANLTLRARKFGYIDTTLPVTLTRFDTLTRNFQIRQAPSGTLIVYSHTATTNLRSYVEVKFGSLVVYSDSTSATTGRDTTVLPTGTYSVRVDAPPPYRTLTFPSVVINAGQTTNVDALTSAVLTFNPTAVRDTLPVGGSRVKNLTITNTSPDSVPFRITDDNALRVNRYRVVVPEPVNPPPAIEKPKGAPDTEFGDSPNGRGGPDAFGYSWIDSDEPDGPDFSWFDIKSVGTQITTWTGSGDDGYAQVTLPFTFSWYGNNYTTAFVGTNGYLSFGQGYTTFTNGSIPSSATPNNAIYAFWDDLNFNEPGGTAWYYYDSANQRFIVQYDSVSHFSPGTTPGRYTFQIVLNPSGEVLTYYRRMLQTVNSATIGIENANGSVGLQVVFNAAYMHDSLAIRYFLPDAPWLSENPVVGTIPPNGNQVIQVTF